MRRWTAEDIVAATGGEVLHWAPEAALPLILRHGLLSATALVALFEVPEPRASRLLEENRRGFETLVHPHHGRAELRRQEMPDGRLGPALAGSDATPRAWRRHINGFVFFWLDRTRAERLRHADPERPQRLIRLDAARLLARHGDAARLTPINTGAVRHPAHRRSFADWHPIGAWADPGGRRPVELAVPWAVPDLLPLLRHGPLLP
jgi:hypothetical protein